MASHSIYQFYSELSYYEPKIWRRFQVMDDITMARLGYIIMTMYEMEASHLFQLKVPYNENMSKRLLQEDMQFATSEHVIEYIKEKLPSDVIRYYEVQNEYTVEFENPDAYVAQDEKMKRSIIAEGDVLTFEYDYGDGWEVSLVLEKIFQDETLLGKELPRVIEGQGFGIVDDVGGVSGLADIAKAFANKRSKEYRFYANWLKGCDKDPEKIAFEKFDIDDMNFRLKKLPRIYKDIYEYDLEMTDRSYNLLRRKYK
ncbi:MAG: plasmid pRiA4b ORF-3 family protein [Lachnospiraceae bacterium]|jgi:hypothetical protein|nr:plasmid pRiA4b ORF-3 family protein [Lachnospiraceae bacterium]